MTHSSRAHFILGVLLIATLVPAAGLAFLQYQALSNMRTQTRQALLESLKQRLVGARVEVETDFLAWPRNALLGDEHHDWLRRGDLRRIHDLSQITRRVCPHVSLFFAYRLSGTNDRASVWIFRPTPEPRHMRLSENDPAEVEIRRLVPKIVLNKFHFYNFYTDLNGERHQVFFHLADRETESGHGPAFGYIGFAIPTKVLAHNYIPAILRRHLSPSEFNSILGDDDLVTAVADETGKLLTPSMLAPEGYIVVQETFKGENSVLPGWVLQVGLTRAQTERFYGARAMSGIGLTLGIVGLMLLAVIAIGVSINRQVHLSRQKSEFVASVSHELRTPLAVIRGYVETLRFNRLRKQEDREEYFQIIEAEIQRLSAMIDRILESSKIEADIKSYKPEPTDVRSVIEETVEHFSYELEKEKVTLDCQIDRSALLALVDPQGLAQTISNLLINAVKYAEHPRRIKLNVRRANGQIAISVTDYGIGIAKHEQKRIFEKFYRVDSGLGTYTEGAGLGLALVRHFAEAHKGSVSVESDLGKGSTFTILLPALAEPTGAPIMV